MKHEIMSISQYLFKKLSPIRILIFGFVILTLTGTFLLMLPEANVNGSSQSFVDALFTATSGVSTTGLIVVDTGSYYTFFGQLVILILVQIGGLGYMVFIVLAFLSQKKNMSIQGRKILRESLSRPTTIDMVHFVKIVFAFTIIIEIVGAAGMYIYWSGFFPFSEAAYISLFHSISGFCTAGFGLFSDSITSYGHSLYLNIVIDLVCIAGAVGFFVLFDVYEYVGKKIKKEKQAQLSLHSKIVLVITFILIIVGTVIVFGFEGSRFSSSFGNKTLDATFQIISASTTTGFNTIDIGSMTNSSMLIIIVLMFIGASPGSTGGGIKTTSFGILIKNIFSTLGGRKDTALFKRKISSDLISNAFILISISLMWITIVVIILCKTENVSFVRILFETVSAFGTVGLSTGITNALSMTGKILITLTMFLGRVGPLAQGFSLFKGEKNNGYTYPEENVLIG
ncbi:MAG: potassium transporter TrkG [Ignavibacteriaceae bacterium]